VGLREREVVDHFRCWLEAAGWEVDIEVDWADITAVRGDRTLIAEAKGTTASAGLDIDTAFGQLLRRMRDDDSTVYAIVIPRGSVRAALRVPSHVLTRLRVSVFSVGDDGTVRHEGGGHL
jgi:hypothetical protein